MKAAEKKKRNSIDIRPALAKLSGFFAALVKGMDRLWRGLAGFVKSCFAKNRYVTVGVAAAVAALAISLPVMAAGSKKAVVIPLPAPVALIAEPEAVEVISWEVVDETEDIEHDIAVIIQEAENRANAVLEYGYTGADVLEVQERLMELGYMDNDEPTTYFGSQTRYAVQLFQRAHELQTDGIAGPGTLELLYSEDAQIYMVNVGISGTDVRELQKRLKELGYLKTGVTGYFGTDTATAVKAFQKRNSLSIDGMVGPQTRESLYSASAKKAATGAKSGGGGSSTTKVPDSASVSALIAEAKNHLGVRYTRGGKSPGTGMDCSGFVYYCLNAIGVKICYMTSGGWANAGSIAKVTSYNNLQAGDIICVRGHVGIYMGGGQVIDASSGAGCIRITDFGKWWKNNWICARRIL